jgi:hypothetical protein
MNGDDYALIDRQVAVNGLGSAGVWVNGDVNYDGSITTTDYLLMDTAYSKQGTPLSPDFLAMRESQFGPSYVAALTAAVPEPSLLGLVPLAACLPVLSPRRRRAR